MNQTCVHCPFQVCETFLVQTQLRDKQSGRGCKQQQPPPVLLWFWRQSSLEKPQAVATTHRVLKKQHHNSHITFLGLLCLDSYFPTRAQPGTSCTAPYPDHSMIAEPSCSTGSVLPSDTALLLTTAVSSSSSSSPLGYNLDNKNITI